MVAIAETIIERRSGAFEPASFRDRYQDALRELAVCRTRVFGGLHNDRRQHRITAVD
jgi:non-homologous end joining protein Ku